MADSRKLTWLENIMEDFGQRSSYDLPEWLRQGIGDNEYVPRPTPPKPMTPEELRQEEAARLRAEQEARRAQVLQADAGLGSPAAMTMPPEMGVAPLDDVTGMGLTGGDMPVRVAPYGATPDLDVQFGNDELGDIVSGIQEADRTRGGGTTGSGGRRGTRPETEYDPVEPYLTTPRGGAVFTGGPDVYQPGDPYASIDYPEMGMDTGVGLTDAVLPPASVEPHVAEGGSSGGATTQVNTELAPTDTTDVKPNKMNAVQRFAQDTLGWDEDKRNRMSEALMTAGFGMMAGDSPYAMQNIGRGGLMGVESYQGAKDQERKEGLEDDAVAMQKEIHEIRMAEGRRAAEKHGIEMKKLQKTAEAGIDPLSLLTGTAKSKAQAAVLYKNGIIDEDTYNSILGIKEDGLEGI